MTPVVQAGCNDLVAKKEAFDALRVQGVVLSDLEELQSRTSALEAAVSPKMPVRYVGWAWAWGLSFFTGSSMLACMPAPLLVVLSFVSIPSDMLICTGKHAGYCSAGNEPDQYRTRVCDSCVQLELTSFVDMAKRDMSPSIRLAPGVKHVC